jgi:hypothetical protein
MRIDLNPGYECPIPEDELDQVVSDVSRRLSVYDDHIHNFAYVPKTDPKFAVVIDPGAASSLLFNVRFIKDLFGFKPPGLYDPQKELYADLRALAREAWPRGEKHADGRKVAAFWRKCVEARAEGRLLAPWTDKASAYEDCFIPARRYGQRLSEKVQCAAP